jgi:hypothetical protein
LIARPLNGKTIPDKNDYDLPERRPEKRIAMQMKNLRRSLTTSRKPDRSARNQPSLADYSGTAHNKKAAPKVWGGLYSEKEN